MKSSLAEIANSQALKSTEEIKSSLAEIANSQALNQMPRKKFTVTKTTQTCKFYKAKLTNKLLASTGEKSCEIQDAADRQSCVGVPRGCSKLIETEIKRARQDFQRQFDSFRQEIRNGLCLPPEFESTEVRTNLVEENKGLRERLKELESRYEVLLQESTKIKEKSLITVIHLLNTEDSSKSSKPVSEENVMLFWETATQYLPPNSRNCKTAQLGF